MPEAIDEKGTPTMNHLTEDTLLKLSLEILDTSEKISAEEHLRDCAQCRNALSMIEEGNRVISEFEPLLPDTKYPLPRRATGREFWWLKVAALLLAGFFAGFGASNYLQPDCVNVIPYRGQPASQAVSRSLPVQCESVMLAVSVR
jgi:hypothetical protein